MKIYTLGTSHGATEPGRSCSGTLLTGNGSSYLFDCGGNVEGKMTDLNLPIQEIKSVFISHMHEDHVGTLSSIAKRFTAYLKTDDRIQFYFPEENAISAFQTWLAAMHFKTLDKLDFFTVHAGEIYSDENITVTAIPTQHMQNGAFPSFAYRVSANGKKILYTGDLAADFRDYPTVVFEEEFDAIVCELVHFNVKNNLDTICKSKTKQMIFTHLSPYNIPIMKSIEKYFPFPIHIAEDNAAFSI